MKQLVRIALLTAGLVVFVATSQVPPSFAQVAVPHHGVVSVGISADPDAEAHGAAVFLSAEFLEPVPLPARVVVFHQPEQPLPEALAALDRHHDYAVGDSVAGVGTVIMIFDVAPGQQTTLRGADLLDADGRGFLSFYAPEAGAVVRVDVSAPAGRAFDASVMDYPPVPYAYFAVERQEAHVESLQFSLAGEALTAQQPDVLPAFKISSYAFDGWPSTGRVIGIVSDTAPAPQALAGIDRSANFSEGQQIPDVGTVAFVASSPTTAALMARPGERMLTLLPLDEGSWIRVAVDEDAAEASCGCDLVFLGTETGIHQAPGQPIDGGMGQDAG